MVVEKVVRVLGVQMRVMEVEVEGRVDKVGIHPDRRRIKGCPETGVQGLRVRSRGHPSRMRVVVRVVDGRLVPLELQLVEVGWEVMLTVSGVVMEQTV
tara:strand:+ start:583 stop:876 length:294 start_codon:yes stop_codon:yes gene_type:complete